jgi:PAS domain S-box-containing protein
MTEMKYCGAQCGAPQYFISVIQDITGRKQAEEERDRFFSQSLNLLCIAGFDGYVKRVNPAWERTLGFRSEELVSAAFLSFVHPDDVAAAEAEIRKLTAGVITTAFEVRCRCKDGGYRWILWNVTPFIDERVMYATGYDITDRKLLQAQFQQAQKMEAIGRLAGGVAHDFNNLLMVILGYAETLKETVADNPEAVADLAEIKKAAERAVSLTQRLLAFSRRQMLQPRVVDLNWIVTGIERMARRLIGEDIKVSAVLSEDLGSVRVDPSHIEQALLNLIVNARDAMPEGGRLTLETKNVELDARYMRHHGVAAPTGSYVMIAVSDTGVGMDKEIMSHLFEPFFTTKGSRGTGLGLATVYGIVKQSGGFIWPYSEGGRGSTFKLYFPRVDAIPLEQAASSSFQTVGGKERILVVEDEPAVRMLVSEVLRRHGYTVWEAATPHEALHLARGPEFQMDVLLTDMVMPGMSGKALADRLRADRPNLPVLYMSGYTDHALLNANQLERGTHFLQKPFTPAALATAVREMLDG